MKALVASLEEKNFSEEWTEMPDFSDFFRYMVGSCLIQTIFGPTMLRLNPEFMRDLWSFDDNVPWFARGVPSFIKPAAYRARQNTIDQLKRWYSYAREHFDESSIDSDGDGDVYWGSWLIRERQKKLLMIPNNDDEAVARTDLGLAWGLASSISSLCRKSGVANYFLPVPSVTLYLAPCSLLFIFSRITTFSRGSAMVLNTPMEADTCWISNPAHS
jgi:hypothetical protein